MRTGRIARTIGQAAAAGLLGLGVSVAGGQAAFAAESVDASPSGCSQATSEDFIWESSAASVTTNDFIWE